MMDVVFEYRYGTSRSGKRLSQLEETSIEAWCEQTGVVEARSSQGVSQTGVATQAHLIQDEPALEDKWQRSEPQVNVGNDTDAHARTIT